MRSSLRWERFMQACGTSSRCLEVVPKITTKIETQKVKKLKVGTEGEAKEGDERTEPTQHYLTKHKKSRKSQKFPAKIHGLV